MKLLLLRELDRLMSDIYSVGHVPPSNVAKGKMSMVVTCVHVFVKPEHVDDFIAATKANHAGSVQEPENIRFDVLQDPDDSTKFLLYEAYESKEGAAAHKQTAHYLTWRETVADWMSEPRQGKPYNVIAP